MSDEVVAVPNTFANLESVTARITWLCSNLDAYFQDFISKTAANDRLGVAIAAVRIAQLSSAIKTEYKTAAEVLVDSKTEMDIVNKAARLVVNQIVANAQECADMSKREAGTPAEADRSKN